MDNYASNQPEWSELVKRAGDLKGDELTQVPGELGLSMTVDDFTLPEFGYLRRKLPYAAYRSQPALAANFSQISLQFPVLNNQMLAIVEQILIANLSVATDYYNIGLSFGPISAGAQCSPRDGRMGGSQQSALRIVQTTSAASAFPGGVGSYMRVAVPAGSTITLDVPYMLSDKDYSGANPSLFLVVENAVVNRECAASFAWRERQLLTSER